MSDTDDMVIDIMEVTKEVATLYKRYRELQLKFADAEDSLLEAIGRLNFMTNRLMQEK